MIGDLRTMTKPFKFNFNIIYGFKIKTIDSDLESRQYNMKCSTFNCGFLEKYVRSLVIIFIAP